MREMLRVGLIGYGTMGMIHAQNLSGRVPKARLVAVADPRIENMSLAYELDGSVSRYADYRELLASPEIDAVVVASASTSHSEILQEAVEAKRPVFCEKPLALTLEDSINIHRRYEAARVPLQIGFMRRFDPHYMAAKQLILEGRIGRPYHYYGLSRDRIGPSASTVHYSGGFCLDTGVHEFDLARWLMDAEVVSVFGRGNLYNHPEYRQYNDVDQLHLSMRFSSDALGIAELSRDAIYGYEIRTEILGTKGAVQVAPVNKSGTALLVDGQVIGDTYRDYRERFQEAYFNEMCEFVRCIREEIPVAVGSGDGIQATVIAKTAMLALQSGRDEAVEWSIEARGRS